MTVKDIMDRVPASRADFVYAHELRSVELLRAKDTPGTLSREVKTISWATDEAGQNVELWLTMQPESTGTVGTAGPAEPRTEPYGQSADAPLVMCCVLTALLVVVAIGTAHRVGRIIGYWERVREEKSARGVP